MGRHGAYDAAPYFTSALVRPASRLRMRMKRWFIAPWLLVAFGSILRVLWSYDFEWKYDEKWMFDRALRIADGRSHFPMIGMASGAGLRNPGASIWPFGLLAHIAPDPHGMTFAIMLANVAA